MGRKRSTDGETDSALIESIDRLRQEVEVLRIVVDELRGEVQYLVRNPGESRVGETHERLRVTSLPLDPAAEDFEQRVNAVPTATVTELRAEAATAQGKEYGATTRQRGLF